MLRVCPEWELRKEEQQSSRIVSFVSPKMVRVFLLTGYCVCPVHWWIGLIMQTNSKHFFKYLSVISLCCWGTTLCQSKSKQRVKQHQRTEPYIVHLLLWHFYNNSRLNWNKHYFNLFILFYLFPFTAGVFTDLQFQDPTAVLSRTLCWRSTALERTLPLYQALLLSPPFYLGALRKLSLVINAVLVVDVQQFVFDPADLLGWLFTGLVMQTILFIQLSQTHHSLLAHTPLQRTTTC